MNTYLWKSILFGYFRLDGGSMFGSVPKTLWERKIEADNDNCIRLAARSILIEFADRKILIDCGCGNKWDEKYAKIYGIETFPDSTLPFQPEEITDLIITHLHFDHAGGVTTIDAETDTPVLKYPAARTFLQKLNLENAKSPTVKEKASYFVENYGPLENADLKLLDGESEILPGITVHPIHGHTRGQQWVKVQGEKDTLVFPSDLIPTSHHLPLPFHMGYDCCAETVLQEKKLFLDQAIQENWIVVFQHDPEVVAARIGKNDRGHYSIREQISF